MTTDSKFVNILARRLMGTTSFKDYFLDYLKSNMEDFISIVYDKDVTIDPTSKVIINPSGVDEFDLTVDKRGTDGSGHILVTDTIYCTNVIFENSSGILYNVALKYSVKPEGININPRTSYPEFDRWVETIGESNSPTSVTNNSTYITFNINNVCPSPTEDYTGRKALVWKNTPAIGATDENIAMEICTVYYSSGNLIDTSTSGIMGQTTVSTTASDYTVLLLGPSVARVVNVNFEPLDDYWYIGTLTGGGGSAPTIPSDSVDNQRLAQVTMSDAFTSYLTREEIFKMSIKNWTAFNTNDIDGPFYGVCPGLRNDGTYDWECFAAAGIYVTGNAILWVSKEGKTWGEATSNTGVYDLYDICFDKNIGTGYWVAVGEARPGATMTVVFHGYIGSSITAPGGPDGTWILNAVAAPSGTPSLRSVTSDGTTFVAVGTADGSGYAVIMSSTNPATWTNRGTAAAITGVFEDICYGNGLFLAVGYNGSNGLLATSTNGTSSWTTRTPDSTTRQFYGSCWNGSVFVIVGEFGVIETSPDGITWTNKQAGTQDYDLWAVASDENGNLVAVGRYATSNDYGIILYSIDDGETWTLLTGIDVDNSVTNQSYTMLPYDITYGHGKFIIAGYSTESVGSHLWASLRMP